MAELCVNAATGDIYAARDDGFAWGREEYLPTFLVVRVECDADAAQQYVLAVVRAGRIVAEAVGQGGRCGVGVGHSGARSAR